MHDNEDFLKYGNINASYSSRKEKKRKEKKRKEKKRKKCLLDKAKYLICRSNKKTL
jgi:hypothetical protein